MQLSGIEANHVTLDMGYRGTFQVTITFVDQNNVEHRRKFSVKVFNEKPTEMQIDVIFPAEDLVLRTIYHTTSDALHMNEVRK